MTRSLPALAALFALVCSSACSSTTDGPTAPAAPTSVLATPSDAAVTLTWDAATGATGYTVYYGTDASGAVTKASSKADAGSATFKRIDSLVNNTLYRFAVTATGPGGESALSAEVTAAPATNSPIAVVSVTPADGATSTLRTTTVSVVFNKPVDPTSAGVGAGTTGTCGNSIALSADNFTTCPNASVALSNGNRTATLTPLAPLAGGATYKVRVTTALKDANGISLTAPFQQATGFVTRPALSFVSQAPAASATSVPRTSTVALVFGRALDPASVTVGSAAQCTGSIQLATSSTFTDGTCVGVTKAVSAGDTTVTLTPAQALAGGTGYWVRTTTALHDVDGLPLPTQYVSPHAFTTAAALAVASFAPAGTSVPRNTQVSVTFTAPPSASTVSTNTSGTACSGSFQLSKDAFATCVTMKAAPGASNGGLTFSMSPAADLDGSTAYTLRVTTDVQDGDGLALSAAATSTPFATSTTVDSTPPGEITGLVTTTTLRSAAFSWTNPGDSDLHGVRVYRRPHGSGAFTLLATIGTDSGGHSATDDGLPGLTSFDYKFTTVDLAGNESSGLIATAVFTGFTGSGADFNDAQRVSMGAATGDAPKLAIGWNADSLYLGISDSTGAGSALGATDTLWIAIDTDPDTDTNGEVRTPTVGVNDILWPFKADLVFKLVPNQLETHVDMHDASTSTFSLASGAIGFDGAVDEVAIPRSLLDSATRVRIAVAAVNDTNGYVFADAPAGRGTDTFAFFASLTSGLDTGTKLFDATAGLAGPANLTTFDAPALITLAVDRGQASDGAVFVQGDQHPLSFTDGVSIHTLTRAGTSTVYSGRFNFGGALGELLFKFRESANGSTNTEPLFSAIGVDRVFELEGGGQVAPTVAWGQSYSASHPFDIAFILCSGGTPTQLRGNVSELGNFSTSNATFVATSACADASNGWVTDVNFAAPNGAGHDFTATPLQFKAYYSDDTFEGGSDHAMNDDILNRRVITWHAGDGSTF